MWHLLFVLLLLQQQAPRTGSIEGVVVNAMGNEPIADAQVGLMVVSGGALRATPLPVQLVNTDNQGRFRLKDIEPASYRIAVSADGFSRQEYGARRADQSGAGTVLEVRAGDSIKDIVVRLSNTGAVSGRITDSDGEPVLGVDVTLLRPTFTFNGQKSFAAAGSALTNDIGEYRIYWIAPGSYYLAVAPPADGLIAANGSAAPKPGAKFTATFYPGVDDPESARTVEIQSGIDLTAIDWRIHQQQTVRIRGRVVGALPAGNSAMNISIIPRQQLLPPRIVAPPPGVQPRADGTFEVRNVLPGQYWIRAFPGSAAPLPIPGPEASSRHLASVAIDVGNEDLENLVLPVGVVTALSGRVTLDGRLLSEAAPNLSLRAYLNIADSRPGMTIPYSDVPVSPDGAFLIESIAPGEYQWGIRGLAPNIFIRDARLGGVDILGRPFRVAGSSADLLNVDLSAKSGEIQGAVRTDNQMPVARAVVALVPDIGRDRAYRFKSTTSDAAGRFTLSGIPPGDYKLFAWEDLTPFSFLDPTVLERYEARGKRIQISDSSRQTADVTVIRAEPQ